MTQVRGVANGIKRFVAGNGAFLTTAGAWVGDTIGPILVSVNANIDEWLACAGAAAQWSLEQVCKELAMAYGHGKSLIGGGGGGVVTPLMLVGQFITLTL